MKSLEDTGFAELAKAKIDARVDAVETWLGDDDNFRKTTLIATGGFTVLAAGLEAAAHILDKPEDKKGVVGRAGLHLAAGLATAGAGLGLSLEGYTAGKMEARGR